MMSHQEALTTRGRQASAEPYSPHVGGANDPDVLNELLKFTRMALVLARNFNRCTAANWQYVHAGAPMPPRADLSIDLQSCTFIDAGFLTRLACVVSAYTQAGFTVTVAFGGSTDPSKYASRLGFLDLLNNLGVEHDMMPVTHHDSDNRFVELHEFGGSEAADGLIEIIEARLVDWGDNYLTSQLRDYLFELGMNIEEHAKAPGFAMAQWFPGKSTLDISVADYGVGIPSSLSEAGHSYETDGQAIEASTQLKVSAKPKDGGAGLAFVRSGVGRRVAGAMRISSGRETVSFGASGPAYSASGWNGTAIDLSYGWIPK